MHTIFFSSKSLLLVCRFVYESSGQEIKYSNWHKKEPNDSGRREDCVHVNYPGHTPLHWNDLACNVKASFVCEKPSKSSKGKSYVGEIIKKINT